MSVISEQQDCQFQDSLGHTMRPGPKENEREKERKILVGIGKYG
jgi:hypothetical protein